MALINRDHVVSVALIAQRQETICQFQILCLFTKRNRESKLVLPVRRSGPMQAFTCHSKAARRGTRSVSLRHALFDTKHSVKTRGGYLIGDLINLSTAGIPSSKWGEAAYRGQAY